MTGRGNLVMVGAGVFGREILSWIEDVPAKDRPYDFKGFIDDDAATAAVYGDRYLGTIDAYVPQPEDLFLCSIAATKIRLGLCRKLEERGFKFINFVHPTVRFDRTSTVGEGSVLGPFVYIGPGAKIGKHVLINVQASVGHDTEIGDGSTMNSHTDLTGGAVLEECVYLGSHASVLQNVRIGVNSKVGAGSVALRNVKPNTSVFGVPSTVISRR